jgi:hypothetical protein
MRIAGQTNARLLRVAASRATNDDRQEATAEDAAMRVDATRIPSSTPNFTTGLEPARRST